MQRNFYIILVKLWPGYCMTQLKTMNEKVIEDNGKALNKGNLRYQKVRWFPAMDFGRTLVVSFQRSTG